MQIYIHWFEASHSLNLKQFSEVTKSLQQPARAWKRSTTKAGTLIYTLSIDNTESAAITFPPHGTGTITIRGSYFDAATAPISAMWVLLQSTGTNIKRLDISYLDNEQLLSFDNIKRMSLRDNYQQYITGTVTANRKRTSKDSPDATNRQGVPDVHANHPLIHYGNADAKSFAKFYQRPDGLNKFEITLRDRLQAAALMDAFTADTEAAFITLAKQALVKTINFVLPSTRHSRRPKKVPAWDAFLGGPIAPLKWSSVTVPIEQKPFADQLRYHVGRMQNLLTRSGLTQLVPQLLDLETIIATAYQPQPEGA